MRFWDSSALVPLFLREPSAEQIKRHLRTASAMFVWWGASVEVYSAVARAVREGRIPAGGLPYCAGKLKRYRSVWEEILPTDPVRGEAQRLSSQHSLRAADALQLAAAIVARDSVQTECDFVCLDQRLSQAAVDEGFTVLS